MFKKILLPTDGSDLSAKAIEGGLAFAKALGARVVGVTVIEPYSYSNLSEYRPETLDDYEQRTAKGRRRASRQGGRCSGQGVGIAVETVTVKSFSPFEAIIDTAKSKGCDVIFMASHGRKGLSAVLLGSETQKVLTHSTIPVMVYR